MSFLHTIILAIVQGITEFLPISSSAHLAMTHMVLGDGTLTDQQEKMLDVSIHIGTLAAVFLYFRKDLAMLVKGTFQLLLTRRVDTEEEKLVAHVLIASIPVFPVGFMLAKFDPSMFDSLLIIGWTTLIFGLLLGWADRKPVTKSVSDLTYKSAFIIGLMQVISLIPGVSRSGITMTGGRLFGIKRSEAARFSMLMAMVVTSGAGVLGAFGVYKSGSAVLINDALWGILFSFISALVVIWGMMQFFSKHNGTMMPFVIYRILLGVTLLTLVYGGFIQPKEQLANPAAPVIEQPVAPQSGQL